jgi:hypothetical protein
MPKGIVYPEFQFRKHVEFLTIVTRKSATVWGHIMDHQKAERITYRNGIQDFRSFSQSKIQKLSSVQPLFYPETEFSSEVDLQNSVTSKPLSTKSCVSNR